MKKNLVLLIVLPLAFGYATPRNKTEEGTLKGTAIGAVD
jgi:hypothetical protein